MKDLRELGPFGLLKDHTVIQIIRFLSVLDRSRLRCTSRMFKSLIDQHFPITDLLVCLDPLKLTSNRWNRTDELIDYKNLVTAINFTCNRTVLLKLQRLKISFCIPYGLLRVLKQFEQLQRLEIYAIDLYNVAEPVRLPQLKYLFVENVANRERGRLTIDAPLLQEVSFGNDAINYVLFTNTDRVEVLEFALDFRQNSIRYPNLKKITCNRVLDLDPDTLDGLLRGSYLTAVYLNLDELTRLSIEPIPAAVGSLQFIFEYLMVLQQNLQIRKDIKLYIHNVELKQVKSFEKYGFHTSFSSLLARNQTKELQTSFCSVNYHKHVAEYKNRLLFVDLKTIFRNIQCVILDCQETLPTDERHFTDFLRRCRGLRQLELVNAPFNDLFYERLPSLPCCITLNYLRLFRSRPLDMSFVLRFEYLAYLITNMATNENLVGLMSGLKKGGYAFYFACYQQATSNLKINKKGRNMFDLEINYLSTPSLVAKYPMRTLNQAIEIVSTRLNRWAFMNLEPSKPPSEEVQRDLLALVAPEQHRLAEQAEEHRPNDELRQNDERPMNEERPVNEKLPLNKKHRLIQQHRLNEQNRRIEALNGAPEVFNAVQEHRTARSNSMVEPDEESDKSDSGEEMDEAVDEKMDEEMDEESDEDLEEEPSEGLDSAMDGELSESGE